MSIISQEQTVVSFGVVGINIVGREGARDFQSILFESADSLAVLGHLERGKKPNLYLIHEKC